MRQNDPHLWAITPVLRRFDKSDQLYSTAVPSTGSLWRTGPHQARAIAPSEFSSPARKGPWGPLRDPAGKSQFISVSQLARRPISCLH